MLRERSSPEQIVRRFESRYIPEPNSGCWIWEGSLKRGYGHFSVGPAGRNKISQAHVFSYEMKHGSVPPGLQLDHLCRVRCCVNHRHLQAVTCRVNVLRGISPAAENAKKTHCKHGHSLSGDNLYLSEGFRYCKICRDRTRKRWASLRKSLYCVNGHHQHGQSYCRECNLTHAQHYWKIKKELGL